MIIMQNLRKLLILPLLWSFATATGYAAAAQTLALPPGEQRVVTTEHPIKRAAIGDPAVADIRVLTVHEMLLTAKQPGVTTLFVWERGRTAPMRYDVRVAPTLHDGAQGPGQSGPGALSARPSGPNMVLDGTTGSLDAHQQALATLHSPRSAVVDTSSITVDPQVQTDIKVVEISRKALQEAGFFLGKNTAGDTAALSGPGTISGFQFGSASNIAIESAGGFLPLGQAYNLAYGKSNRGLLGVLSALENNGFAYTLAEPSLVTLSGQTASFLVGGEFPVPVVQGSGNTNAITITYKQFGVRLQLTPTVLSADRIALKVAPEVSELDFSSGVRTGGVTVPALRVRRTDTTVRLGNGESFVIGGLISRSTSASVDKFPFLGDIPVLGAFFRSTRFEKNDKELIMIVTPHLVRPFAAKAALPPLPGERFRHYSPSTGQTLFLETGRFGQDPKYRTGFSN